MKSAAHKRIGRREFIRNTSATSFAALVGMRIPYLSLLPAGLVPIALTHAAQATIIPQKPGLVVLNDRPLNAETPAHLLDDAITPAARMFVRNNGIPPQLTAAQVADWTLSIGGESCTRPTQLSLRDLQQKFRHHTYQLQLECGGNGRSEFFPPARGNQWSTGAVSCAQWTGVRLRDVLQHCGIQNDAVYIGYNSADSHLSGDPKLRPISRGVPINKALEDETLIAWALNGADIPPLHGYPLRLVCGGWPASASGKWLNEILVRDRVHDGAKMTG